MKMIVLFNSLKSPAESKREGALAQVQAYAAQTFENTGFVTHKHTTYALDTKPNYDIYIFSENPLPVPNDRSDPIFFYEDKENGKSVYTDTVENYGVDGEFSISVDGCLQKLKKLFSVVVSPHRDDAVIAAYETVDD